MRKLRKLFKCLAVCMAIRHYAYIGISPDTSLVDDMSRERFEKYIEQRSGILPMWWVAGLGKKQPPSLDDFSYLLRLEAENVRRHGITALGDAQLDGNGSVVLDGTGDYLKVDRQVVSTGAVNNPMTLGAWVKFTSLGNSIIMKQNDGNEVGDFLFIYNDGSKLLEAIRWNGGSNIKKATHGFSPSTGVWYYLSFSWKADGDVFISVDGTGATYTPSNNTSGWTSETTIGADSVFGAYSLHGAIGQLEVADNIARYTANFTPPVRTDPIVVDEYTVLALNFEGAEGWKDSSNSQHNISVNGDSQLDGNRAVVLDGSTAYLNTPVSDDWNLGGAGSGDFTIEFYINFDTLSTGNHGMLATYDTGTNGWQMYYVKGLDQIDVWNGSTTRSVSWTPSLSTWYHVAMVRSGSTITIYIDGTSIGTVSDGDFNNDGAGLGIGVTGSISARDPIDGKMAQVHVSKGVARYTSNFTPPVRTDPIVVDEYSVLSLDFEGPSNKVRILDSAKPGYEVTANDDFSSSNLSRKWKKSAPDGTAELSSGAFRFTADPSGVSGLSYYNSVYAEGDFIANVDINMVTYLANTTTVQNAQLRLENTSGTFRGAIFLTKDGADSNDTWRIVASSGFNTQVTNSAGNVTLQAKRVGSVITYKYGSTTVAQTDTNSETLRITLFVENQNGSGSLVVDFDNFTLTDELSAPLEGTTDPEGSVGVVLDVSGNENDGICTNVTYDAVNQELVFAGNGYIDCGTGMNASLLGALTSYTVMNLDPATSGYIWSNYDNPTTIPPNTDDGISLTLSSGKGRFDTFLDSSDFDSVVGAADVRGSRKLVSTKAVSNGSTRNEIYLDGVIDSDTRDGSAITQQSLSPNPFYVGARPALTKGDPIGAFLTGRISSVIIQDGLIVDAERQDIENALQTKYGV